MSKIKIEFEIEENYCYSTGKFCWFMIFIKFGTTPVCTYFNEKLIQDENYKIERLKECKEKFNENNN